MRFLANLLFCLIAIGVAVPATAAITVYPLRLTFDQPQSKQDFTVTNTDSKKVAYVAIKVSRVENPATPQQKEVVMDNPQKSGLLVSPVKLALPPGGSRLVRVSLIRPFTQEEQRYRLEISPKEGELVMAEAPAGQSIRAGVHLIVAYGMEIVVPPAHPNTKFSLIRTSSNITASNQGNTIVTLYDGKQCTSADKCEKITGRYELAPGAQTKFTVPKAIPVLFSQRILGESTPLQSN